MEPVTPSVGWGVLHLYYRVDRERADRDPEAGKRVADAVASLEAGGHQAVCMAMLGHKADIGVMALGPDLARLHAFQAELLQAPLEPVWSYVSLTELSEYGATEDDERARLAAEEQLAGYELEQRLAAWRERFEMVVADLLALPRTPPVLAEGPGLLPGCVAPRLTSRRQAIWLVPTEAFKRATQPTRGGAPANQTSDHARAYDNLIALDLRLAAYVKERAVDLGLPVLDVDGTRPLADTAVLVAEHFALAARATDRPDQ